MDMLVISLLIISFLLNAVLGFFVISFSTGARRLRDIIADVRGHGMQRRIHFGLSSRPLIKISTELNCLMDEFQTILKKKQRLELSQKQLISNISHDIRTPLTSLMGYIEVLKGQNLEKDARKEYLDIVYRKACLMHRMIEEFFELARLESEDRVLELVQINLNEIVQETLASFYQDFVRTAITPEVTLPEEPIMVLGDRGKGISESELPYVFDRLYTADGARSGSSAGLGLAIARQLVKKQNGEITVQSIPGVRTVFSFYLYKA